MNFLVTSWTLWKIPSPCSYGKPHDRPVGGKKVKDAPEVPGSLHNRGAPHALLSLAEVAPGAMC